MLLLHVQGHRHVSAAWMTGSQSLQFTVSVTGCVAQWQGSSDCVRPTSALLRVLPFWLTFNSFTGRRRISAEHTDPSQATVRGAHLLLLLLPMALWCLPELYFCPSSVSFGCGEGRGRIRLSSIQLLHQLWASLILYSSLYAWLLWDVYVYLCDAYKGVRNHMYADLDSATSSEICSFCQENRSPMEQMATCSSQH